MTARLIRADMSEFTGGAGAQASRSAPLPLTAGAGTTGPRRPVRRRGTTIAVASLCLFLTASGAGPAATVAKQDGGAASTTSAGRRPQLRTVGLAELARGWSPHWAVTGAKTEPTYIETIRISRSGNLFTLVADINGQEIAHTEMSVDDQGQLSVIACLRGASCAERPFGFLATVQVLAVARRGQAIGTAPVFRYADREVVCVPVGLVWATGATRDAHETSTMDSRPILDPCLDVVTGAVLAQRSRYDGRFDGPTLDEGTLTVRNLSVGVGQPSPRSRRHAGPLLCHG